MEILTFVVSVLSMIGTAGAAVYAGRAIERARAAEKIAEASLRFQVLLPALMEYRTAEMLVSIRTLWAFARANRGDLQGAYRAQYEIDSAHLAELRGQAHLDYLRGTLDFHRRQVSQFYGFLTSVYDEGGAQRKWIYTHWGRSDLQIIPDIIVPLEKELGATIGTPASPTTLDRLLRLYEDSPTLPTSPVKLNVA